MTISTLMQQCHLLTVAALRPCSHLFRFAFRSRSSPVPLVRVAFTPLRRQLSSRFWMLSSPQMLITSLTGLVPERVQLTVHTTEPTGTVPEPFHCDHITTWSARTGTSGRSGTGLNTGNWNGSGMVPVPNLWCEHGLRVGPTFIGE